jgi:exosortase B
MSSESGRLSNKGPPATTARPLTQDDDGTTRRTIRASTSTQTLRERFKRGLGTGVDGWVLLGLLLGFALLYLPTYWDLAHTIWASDEQGHGPIILGLSLWLLYRKREQLAALPTAPALGLGSMLCALALTMYALGRSQGILLLEVGSQIVLLSSLLLLFKGYAGWRWAWFALFFMLFMVPLPGTLVALLTTPLKSAVSMIATGLLYQMGYPIARSGVVLMVGPYQLLVADACAGLNSMFTLEALGMLYMSLMGYTSVKRNIALAALIVPISFSANVVRVILLVLVTYHFGDEAGQGFVHGFAGMVLFMVALSLMLMVDRVLGFFFKSTRDAASPTSAASSDHKTGTASRSKR